MWISYSSHVFTGICGRMPRTFVHTYCVVSNVQQKYNILHWQGLSVSPGSKDITLVLRTSISNRWDWALNFSATFEIDLVDLKSNGNQMISTSSGMDDLTASAALNSEQVPMKNLPGWYFVSCRIVSFPRPAFPESDKTSYDIWRLFTDNA